MHLFPEKKNSEIIAIINPKHAVKIKKLLKQAK
jgi:hypothetical protein